MTGVYNNVKNIVAIGDLHGDILQLITILLHSKLIKKKNKNKCVSKSDYDINKGEAIDTTATGDNRSPQEVTQDTLNEFNDKFKNMIDSSRKHLDSISTIKQKASKAEQKEQ